MEGWIQLGKLARQVLSLMKHPFCTFTETGLYQTLVDIWGVRRVGLWTFRSLEEEEDRKESRRVASQLAGEDVEGEDEEQTSLKWYSTIAVLSGTLAPAGTFLKNNDKICPAD